MSESPLEKVIRLASVNVRGFERTERGRRQTVRPHTENVRDAANPRGYISEPKWLEGQKIYEQRGEAAWEKRGAEARAADAARDAKEDAARSGWQHISDVKAADDKPSGWQHISQVMRDAGGVATQRPGRSLQDMVGDLEAMKRGHEDDFANDERFHGPGTMPQSPVETTEQQMHNAADAAIDEAASRGGIDPNEIAELRKELGDLQEQLSHAMTVEEKDVKEQEENDKDRAMLAIHILGIVGSILIAALTGGIGAIVAEVFAGKWTVELARELADYHAAGKGRGRKALAHPVAQTKAGAKKAARGTVAVKTKVAERRTTGPRKTGQ